MAHRGIPARTPDFDSSKLQGASSQVGFLGVEPLIGDVGRRVILILVVSGFFAYAIFA